MERMSVVLMIALALAGAPSAIAQQAQGSQARPGQPLCRDAKGATYSAGALIRDTEGAIVRCWNGEWEPAPPSATGAPAVTQTAETPTAVSMTNVRLDLTITDQTTENASPVKKAISMLLAERGNGRVRSSGIVHANPSAVPYQVSLNADAFIERVESERIRLQITVEYAPVGAEGAGAGQRGSPLNQSVIVVLTNGKPTVIVQAADPLTDRKVTLEATAAIVR